MNNPKITRLTSALLLIISAVTNTLEGTPQDLITQGFLQRIFTFFGQNGSLSTENLEELLDRVGASKLPDSSEAAQDLQHDSQCLSVNDFFSLYGMNNHSRITAENLKSICPAIIQQVIIRPCVVRKPESNVDPVHADKPLPYQVWGFGILAVTLINLAALLGLALIPCTKKPYFNKVLTYFIGLAIGTLFSNAVLQLIPEAFGFDPKVDDYVFQAVAIFGGFYLLFFLEKVLKIILKADQHGHSHSHLSPSEECPPPSDGAEKMVMESNKNGDTIFNTQIVTITNFGTISDRGSIDSSINTISDTQVKRSRCSWMKWQKIGNIKTIAWMITLSDALHNFIDGLAIGASFTVSMFQGLSTSIAIVCEEFPHELGDFIILLNAGMSIPQAMFFNLLSACSCYFGLILGIIIGNNFSPNIIFALAGGMFLYIALADMFPELNNILKDEERTTRNTIVFFLIQNAGMITGFAIILLITLFAGHINFG
ncbi:metal cation symporter ZIP8 [Polypterus senegalus]|uniref:metal cation symporter ZIP8 n=1 Tax=Polypterus senegalus TaxID=55291 RepID=UPI00196500A4|nr:metal cation symporter ZIP8 [Polypterus senegalus]